FRDLGQHSQDVVSRSRGRAGPGHRLEVALPRDRQGWTPPMAAYVIGELIEVTDSAGFEEYRRRAPVTIERCGGGFIVRRGRLETLDGAWPPNGLVVTEFPSMEQATTWYDSAEY